ncbi:MAG: RloB family protein, partial [Saprospiraceae bacterium]
WCVFDMDVKKREKEFADYDNAIEKAKVQEPEYKVAYSNDAFELWFYLHYDYTEQQNHRKFYYDELSKKWNINYVKEGKKYAFCLEIYARLENDTNASQLDAIKRAEKLYKNQEDLPYHQQNPVTKIYELVEFLNQNLRR